MLEKSSRTKPISRSKRNPRVSVTNWLAYPGRLRKKHKYILAEFSSSECKSCCKYEVFYANLMKKFLAKNKYLKEELNVHFVRIDIQKHFWALGDYKSDRVPFLVLYAYLTPHLNHRVVLSDFVGKRKRITTTAPWTTRAS